jgi:RNA polymerase sigma-70 factor (ECF subfamily)
MRQDSARRRRFDELFGDHGAGVVAYCGWRADSHADAQDAAADVFLTAWRRLDEVPRGDAARVWLYATARRVLANQRRSTRRRGALHSRLALEAIAASPAPSAAAEEQSLVRQALGLLGKRDREVLLLAEWEGLTADQIAAVVGCLSVTARGRLHRARTRFRAAFEDLSSDEHEPRRASMTPRTTTRLS